MASGGVTARNTRQGFRSEYIAKYIFSAFGTAVDVSSENDIGLDLLCNLTYDQNKLIVYKSSYGIQVKSKGKPFKYAGRQVTTWLSKLEFPLILVEVDKPNSSLSVYSTWNLNRYLLGLHSDDEANYPEEILFDTTNTEDLNDPDCVQGIIPVGKPILELKYNEIDNKEECDRFYEILSEWLDIENRNYTLRRAGVSSAYGYIRWETNRRPSDFHVWYKPYFYSPHHTERIVELLAEVWPVLGLYHKASSNNGIHEPFRSAFNDLFAFAQKHLHDKFGDFEKSVFDKEL